MEIKATVINTQIVIASVQKPSVGKVETVVVREKNKPPHTEQVQYWYGQNGSLDHVSSVDFTV